MKDDKTIILGIETSCDETAAAVTANGREVLSNVIASQIDVHKVFGGVVPEIASRHHLQSINVIVDEAIKEAGVSRKEIDAIAVTKGPGLVGAVLIGVATAKAMAFALGKPLIGVHHIKGHIVAPFLENDDLEPPFLSLVVSGGHTALVEVKSFNEMKILGKTRDDAVGEAYDKVARVLGLGYPGGPKIDNLAKEGTIGNVEFKRVMLDKGSLDFSFSGIKTGVLNYLNTKKQAGEEINSADIAAGFQDSVIDVLLAKTFLAIEKTGNKKLTLAGGVASNSALRHRMEEECAKKSIELFLPSPVYCTDNAAMIACAGYYDFLNNKVAGLDLDAHAVLELT